MLVLYFRQVVCETKFFLGATWLKIFYHDSSTAQYFNNYSEVLKCSSSSKFSIIGEIDAKYKFNDKYEFLLEYPELNKYNRWRQTRNPKDNPDVYGQKADGYEAVDIYYSGQFWGGLVICSIMRCAFDGSAGHEHWFYAIGCYGSWLKPNAFPGPAIDSNIYYEVFIVFLWVRIDNTMIMNTLDETLMRTYQETLGITLEKTVDQTIIETPKVMPRTYDSECDMMKATSQREVESDNFSIIPIIISIFFLDI